MEYDLSSAILKGIKTAFLNLGTSGKVVLVIIAGFLLLPWVLRVLSFFRRGGEGV